MANLIDCVAMEEIDLINFDFSCYKINDITKLTIGDISLLNNRGHFEHGILIIDIESNFFSQIRIKVSKELGRQCAELYHSLLVNMQ